MPIKSIFWFLLNPLILLELTGNLHLEGVMLCLLLMALYWLLQHQRVASAVFVGLSVATKLLPLVLLPILYAFFVLKPLAKRFSIQRIGAFTSFVFLVFGVVALSFWGLANRDVIDHFGSSVALWFGTFEFNASVYYVLRWIGYQWVGWNTIGSLSKILPVFVFLFVIYLAFIKKSNLKSSFIALLLASSVYLFLATTVHPWYLATPLLLGVFTQFRYMVVWSGVVMLSYAAYQQEGYYENLWLVALEYLVVIGVMVYEFFFSNPKKTLRFK